MSTADEQLRQSTGRAMFGRDEYYVSFLGEPSATEPWLLQFGGHHLALNITFAGEQGTLAPSHTAAQPAFYELEGRTVRPLGREAELGFALLESLDEKQREQAILGFQVRDLVLGPGRDGQTIQPEGIKGSELTARQRELLLDLAGEWTGIMHGSAGEREASRARSGRRRHVVRVERSDREGEERLLSASRGRPCISSMPRKAETSRRRTSTRSTAIRPTSTALAGGRASLEARAPAARAPATRVVRFAVVGARPPARRISASHTRQHRADGHPPLDQSHARDRGRRRGAGANRLEPRRRDFRERGGHVRGAAAARSRATAR